MTRCLRAELVLALLSAYGCSPVLSSAIWLRVRYAIPGTETAYGATSFHQEDPSSGCSSPGLVNCGPTRIFIPSPVLTWRMPRRVSSPHAPTVAYTSNRSQY
eukprot:574442-Rhodomonas_salina.3